MGKTSIGKQIGGNMPEDKDKAREQEIEDRNWKIMDRFLFDDHVPIDSRISAFMTYNIDQLKKTIEAGAEKAAALTKTTNRLTDKIKTLNWIMVIIGSAAVLVGLANLAWMIYTSCIK